MKLTKIEFDGSTEEFKYSGVASLFSGQAHADSASLEPAANGKMPVSDAVVAEPEEPIEPAEAIRLMLQRLPMRESLKELFNALKDGPLTLGEIEAKTGWDSRKLRGVIGGLGRRAHGTPEILRAGLEGNSSAILKWEQLGEDGAYSLQPYAVEALQSEGII